MTNMWRTFTAVAVLLVAACKDEPIAPHLTTSSSAGANAALAALLCSADVPAAKLSCAPAASASVRPKGVAFDVVFGGQGSYVNLSIPSSAYISATGHFEAQVTVQNLLAQPIGTADGITPDTGGVKLFFQSGPTVTGGSGTVAVSNASGTGTFTATNQPFFELPEIIPGNGTSSTSVWDFAVGSSVTAFTFTVLVQARLPNEQTPLSQLPHAFPGGLTAGFANTCAVRATAGVYCWGDNEFGQLGLGNPPVEGGIVSAIHPTPAPVTFPQPAPSIAALAQWEPGPSPCALTTTGTVYCWGENNINGAAGLLANGTTTSSSTPVPVPMPAGITFTQLAQGFDFACALTTAGAVYCWGGNADGQLGDSTTTNRLTPTLAHLPPGVVATQVVTGNQSEFACILVVGGAAYCWGENGGQLGNGGTANSLAPVAVQMPAGVSFTQLAAGLGTTCALSAAGAAYCWGNNAAGQLGINNTTSKTAPTAVIMPSGVTFTQIAEGFEETCAIATTGAGYCWGGDLPGVLGNGTTGNSLLPTPVTMPSGVTFSQIAMGSVYACALSAGSPKVPYCWGDNSVGELGDATQVARLTPVQVNVPGGVSLVQLGAGQSYMCAVTSVAGVDCWGGNGFGQLGNGSTDVNYYGSTVPVLAQGSAAFTVVTAGHEFACGLGTAGAAYCWGLNSGTGDLGDGTQTNRYAPTPVAVPAGVALAQISAGGSSACALSTGSAVYCWGVNSSGQIGDSTTTMRLTPTKVAGSVQAFAQVATGYSHACALVNSGAAYCWGSNTGGQVGDGSVVNRASPTAVAMPVGVSFTQIVAGGTVSTGSHSCGLTGAGAVYCWGTNAFGEVGDGTTTTRSSPALVNLSALPAGVTVTQLAAGGLHTCAVTTAGTIYCWGDNASGQLGDGTTTTRSAAAIVAMPTGVSFTQVAAGNLHTCASTAAGAAYCWGSNAGGEQGGQIGDGTAVTRRLIPTAVVLP